MFYVTPEFFLTINGQTTPSCVNGIYINEKKLAKYMWKKEDGTDGKRL